MSLRYHNDFCVLPQLGTSGVRRQTYSFVTRRFSPLSISWDPLGLSEIAREEGERASERERKRERERERERDGTGRSRRDARDCISRFSRTADRVPDDPDPVLYSVTRVSTWDYENNTRHRNPTHRRIHIQHTSLGGHDAETSWKYP